MSTMTENIDLGTTAAKQLTWEKNSYRALVRQVREENPDLDDEQLFHIWLDRAGPYFMEIHRYCFANALRALQPRQKGESVDRTEARAQAAKGIRVVLLDLMLPNGKMLRDSTFGECAKAGGWLSRVAKMGQLNEKVGVVLTEKDVRAAWQA